MRKKRTYKTGITEDGLIPLLREMTYEERIKALVLILREIGRRKNQEIIMEHIPSYVTDVELCKAVESLKTEMDRMNKSVTELRTELIGVVKALNNIYGEMRNLCEMFKKWQQQEEE